MVIKAMELKDVILSTLAEMDSSNENDVTDVIEESIEKSDKKIIQETPASLDDEERYLQNIKERLLVLFEGFQSPNNSQIEAKVDLTLNFLEYLLSTIETRLEKIKQ
jgi:hypothetical protein